MAAAPTVLFNLRTNLLPLLYEEQERNGWLSTAAVARVAAEVRIPVAEAWEAATSYPDFAFEPPADLEPVCAGLSCVLNGTVLGRGQRGVHCQFRCYEAPAPGTDAPMPPEALRLEGSLLRHRPDGRALGRARSMGREGALAELEASGLRGRGGAYFPTARKWRTALEQGRPIALVVNAEEGEPGVFKDRALLGLRPDTFVEGLAIACAVLEPELVVIFINGQARAARRNLEVALVAARDWLPVEPRIVPGGGGYVLGEESTMLNAIEGHKPVPRLRPPYPVESGLFGMPTVINNVETIAALGLIFGEGAGAFAVTGHPDPPGTRLVSLSGRVSRPGVYEVPTGTTIEEVVTLGGGAASGELRAVLCGGPSGGFLPPSELGRPLLPGAIHPTGAIMGAGGLIVLDSTSDLRAAALAMAEYNAEESCGKCTPCREGTPRLVEQLSRGEPAARMEELLEVIGAASLCGLGQMAPGPVRSALHFWPELF